jgi:hypothetical protein
MGSPVLEILCVLVGDVSVPNCDDLPDHEVFFCVYHLYDAQIFESRSQSAAEKLFPAELSHSL